MFLLLLRMRPLNSLMKCYVPNIYFEIYFSKLSEHGSNIFSYRFYLWISLAVTNEDFILFFAILTVLLPFFFIPSSLFLIALFTISNKMLNGRRKKKKTTGILVPTLTLKEVLLTSHL